MIRMHIVSRPPFRVSGKKTWISGQHNEEFADFWAQCNADGTCAALQSASSDPQNNVTHSRILGVSRVERDPANRAFDFYIASEADAAAGFETFTIEGGLWAVFDGDGDNPMALIRAEMEAFLHFLPESGYQHDCRPEIEVYPSDTETYVQFWLPIRKKEEETMRLGALEAGGTKMVCSIGNEKGDIFERVSIPTLGVDETLSAIAEFFEGKGIEALGIGTFGPVELNKSAANYGCITTTPKPGWKDAPILPYLRDRLKVPCVIDTDVNAAALAEWKMGAGKGLQSLVYVTVGTGIGAGIVAEGNLVHGLMHPEAGHMMIRPMRNDPNPTGFCPYHKSCLEGLACGPTFDKRWGKSAKELPHDHVGWDLEADYLAQFCVNALTLLSAECIVLGGGVMQQDFLFPKIREKTLTLLNGYIANDRLLNHIDSIIVPPGLGINSGVTGSLLLAEMALSE